MTHLSRRTLLKLLAAAAPAHTGFAALHAGFAALLPPAAPALFEPMPLAAAGIAFTHTSGRSSDYFLPETTGAGCAFLDFDNDGWMDIYLVNSGPADFYTPAAPLRNALYKNNRDGTFTDVTLKAGVPGGGYGMGVAVGDYNADGFPDMFVTGYDRSFLYRNNGDGTFTDVTEKSGIRTPGWSSSAVWFDYDNDGKLDLFVCQFVKFKKGDNRFCGDGIRKERHYCVPRFFEPAASWLFRNNGDGTFTDVSEQTGIAKLMGKAWGAVATDLDNDGYLDLFVANDTAPNFLLMNQHGRFVDKGLESGVAFSEDGKPRSGMGVDSADIDGDGFQDLFVTNVDREMYSLYRNHHDGSFDDLAGPSGLGAATRNMSGWGVRFFDYDNDGNVDLFIANGHPDDQIALSSVSVTYREPLLLYHNDGKAMRNVSDTAGPVFQQQLAARGLATGDFNNDGAVDVLVSQNNGPPLLLRNNAARGNHWLGVRLVGKTCNRDAIGARVTWKAGPLLRSQFKQGGGSYLSSHDPRMVLGLAGATSVDSVVVHWPLPSTRVEVFHPAAVDRYMTLVEGEGTPAAAKSGS